MNLISVSRRWMFGLLLCSLPFQSMAQIAGRVNGRRGRSERGDHRQRSTHPDRKRYPGVAHRRDRAPTASMNLPMSCPESTLWKRKRRDSRNRSFRTSTSKWLRCCGRISTSCWARPASAWMSRRPLSRCKREDSQVGGVVETKAVNDLPLNGRDFTQLMILLPGATEGTPAGTTGKHYTERVAGLSFSVNGQRSNYNQFLIDGFMAKEVQSGTAAVSPIIDSLMEFRVQTSNYSAQFGTEAGGQINTVLRSGTNDLHGTLWEYLRNNDLDANDFFSNLSGRPQGRIPSQSVWRRGGRPGAAAEVQRPQPHVYLRRLRGHENGPGRYADTDHGADRQPAAGHLHVGHERSSHWRRLPEQPDPRQPDQFDQ